MVKLTVEEKILLTEQILIAVKHGLLIEPNQLNMDKILENVRIQLNDIPELKI